MFYWWRLTAYITLLLLWEVPALLKNNIQDDLFACDLNGGVKLQLESFSLPNSEGNEIIYWSGCNLQKSPTICPPNSLACVKGLSLPGVLISLGDSFKLISNGSGISFRSQNGAKCAADSRRNYTTYISFDEHSVKPNLQHTDDKCSYNISVSNEKTEPLCTLRVGAFLLDFRDLQNDFEVNSNDSTFVFNLCQSPEKCQEEAVSTCVFGSRNENLAFSTTRRITYEEENAKVEFHFTNGVRKGKGRLDTIIELNCDWNTLYGIPKYLPTSSRKTSKFALNTALGCVKLPMNCKFLGIDKYEYDLSVLYKSDGSWTVSNDMNNTIRMNICGPLHRRQGECNHREAQICETMPGGKYVSYGGILTEKRVEAGILKAKLSHGSACLENASRTLSTNLNFVCSLTERGPKLLGITNCIAEVFWETPAACPKFTVASKTLIIYDNLGQRNLMALCGQDRRHLLDPNTYILYNLCKPLSKPCDNSTKVSVCLQTKGRRETILGFYKEEKLFSRNDVIAMEFEGNSSERLTISFSCDYDAPIDGQTSVRTIRDYSVYSMNIRTPGACVTKINHQNGQTHCTLTEKSNFFNLSGLALSDQNYRYLNNQNGVEYILNICNPVVTDLKTFCAQNSGVCIQNHTEPNFRNRFRVAGSYPGKLKIIDGQLVLHLTNGYLCSKGDFASTIIRFVCTDIEEDPSPKLVSATDCLHEFSWKTRHACPLLESGDQKRPSYCIIPRGGDTNLNLAAVRQKFQLPYENKMNVTFDMCSDFYTEAYDNGTSIRRRAVRTADRESVAVTISTNCYKTVANSWNKLKILLACKEHSEPTFEEIAVENCTVYVRCYSRAFCSSGQQFEDYQVDNNHAANSSVFELALRRLTDVVERVLTSRGKTNIEGPKPRIKSTDPPTSTTRTTTTKIDETAKVCTFKVNKTEINLNDLVPVRINSDSGSRYTVGMGERSCKGYVCKDVVPLASLRTCPNISEEGAQVKMLFNNTLLAGKPFTTVMVLKCNVSAEEPRINSETDTSLTLSYPFDQLCPPPTPISSSNAGGWIAGVFVVLAAVLASGGGWWWYKRRKKHYSCLRGANKEELYLYARDAQA